MDPSVYREYLIHSLGAKSASGGNEVVCRCRYCMDGKHKDSAHMYISIPKEGEPSLFDCKLCHTSGIVTHKTLSEWDIFDSDIAMELIVHNKGLSERYKSSISTDVYKLYNDIVSTNLEQTKGKLSYINDRLGLSLTYQDCMKLKIVLNLGDVLERNKLRMSRKKEVVNNLDLYYMGFISFDNAFVNMRRIVDEGIVPDYMDNRYMNYRLYNKMDNTKRFYTIPNSIKLDEPDRIPIHIAEGPFDILSIYYLRNKERGIYTSIAGSNYFGVLNHFIHTMKLPYVEIHIYPDNDKYGSDWVVRNIHRYLDYYNIPLYLHRNLYKGEKDFGVDRDHIKESVKLII